MASAESKARRRAAAANRLDDLAVQLGEKFGVAVPDLRLTGRDPDLARIQQMEATCALLESILAVSESAEEAAEVEDKPAPKASKKSAKKTTRRKR